MDTRSAEARHVESAFHRAKMKMVPEGFYNVEIDAIYGRTTEERFVRYDRSINQYNVLRADRSRFEPVDALRPGEAWRTEPRMTMDHLLPQQTFWEKLTDVPAQRLGMFVLVGSAGYLLQNLVSVGPGLLHCVRALFPKPTLYGRSSSGDMHTRFGSPLQDLPSKVAPLLQRYTRLQSTGYSNVGSFADDTDTYRRFETEAIVRAYEATQPSEGFVRACTNTCGTEDEDLTVGGAAIVGVVAGGLVFGAAEAVVKSTTGRGIVERAQNAWKGADESAECSEPT